MPSPSASSLPSPASPPLTHCLVRVSEIFAPFMDRILESFGAVSTTVVSPEFSLIKTATPEAVREGPAACFGRWNLTVGHSWPCNPPKIEGFIEKAAQALLKKFGAQKIQGIFTGTLTPGSENPYYKRMASNLRGRLLTVFPTMAVSQPEEQNPNAPSLFCMVGISGLYAGIGTPKQCNGFYPGGSKHVALQRAEVVSRAAAKIVESLHFIELYRAPLPERAHWLDLGASPGGMTAELLNRGYRVTAVDRAPLDARLNGRLGLRAFVASADEFVPPSKLPFDAIACDMNIDPRASLAQVIRLSEFATPKALIVFTLKFPGLESFDASVAMLNEVINQARAGGLTLIAKTHLTYNRQEMTLFFVKDGESPLRSLR